MIKRVWRGWTEPDNADAYQEILLTKVIPMIEAKAMPGFISIEVLRQDLGDEVEFSTVMTFDALENVTAFQGADYARAHVPDIAQAVLKRWDQTARHYEHIKTVTY